MTYAFELMRTIFKNCKADIEMVSLNYTAEGLEAKIKDVGYDGQLYTIKITPENRHYSDLIKKEG